MEVRRVFPRLAAFRSLSDAVVQQESSGRAGVQGPPTQWGRALGLMQTLPDTAKEMAKKIGLPWRPDLLTDKSEAGAQYQRAVGEAYLQEGLEKTGNIRDALRYYHGGPDRKMWGPKTNNYADSILSKWGPENLSRYGYTRR